MNRNYHAPVTKLLEAGGTEVLDSGCGPATWTFEVVCWISVYYDHFTHWLLFVEKRWLRLILPRNSMVLIFLLSSLRLSDQPMSI